LDETPLYANSAPVAAIANADLQTLQFPETLGFLLRKEPVKPEIAATIAAVANGQQWLGSLDSQPDGVPS
jgi:hypothetical protein